MAIEGNLAHVGLADICQLLSMGRKTGCLSISNRPNYGKVYFRQGRVVHASVLNRPDRLGALLLGNGVVTEQQLAAGVAEQRRSGARLGQILVGQGALSQEELERYITVQIEEAVYTLFGWTEGTFRFEPDAAPEDGLLLVSVNAEGLLLEGARRVDEWGQIEKKIPSFDFIFSVEHLPPEDDADIALTENQKRILPLIDGQRAVDDLAEHAGLVEFDAAKALFGLIQAGFVTKTGQRTSQQRGAAGADGVGAAFHRSGMFTDALRHFEAIVAKDPTDAEGRFGLAVVQLKLGEYESCLENLDALGEPDRSRPGAVRNRALALELLGRLDEADAALAEGADHHAGIALARAIVALKQGDTTQARKRFEHAYQLHEIDEAPAVLYNYWVLSTALDGELDEAVRIGTEAVDRHPDEPALLVNVGAVREETGQADLAEALFLKAVALPDPPPQAHKNLGDFAYRRGDAAGARAHYERAVKLDPKLGDDVYCKLAEIANDEDDVDWAIMLWRRALELNPHNASARAATERLAATQES